jgi:tripartite-type tricarboxylate transporter receptor subunit TctC
MLNTAPMVLVARPGLEAQTFADFVKLAKAKPGTYNYATSGVGTVLQLAMELLKQRSGIFVTHVPYRGGAQIATDVIGNQVDLAMLVSTSAIPQPASRGCRP